MDADWSFSANRYPCQHSFGGADHLDLTGTVGQGKARRFTAHRQILGFTGFAQVGLGLETEANGAALTGPLPGLSLFLFFSLFPLVRCSQVHSPFGWRRGFSARHPGRSSSSNNNIFLAATMHLTGNLECRRHPTAVIKLTLSIGRKLFLRRVCTDVTQRHWFLARHRRRISIVPNKQRAYASSGELLFHIAI